MEFNDKKVYFFCCIILLVVIVSIPFLLQKGQDYFLLDVVHKEKYNTITKEEPTNEFRNLDKIKLLNRYFRENDNNIIMTTYDSQFNEKKHLPILKKELNELSSLQIIPKIDFDKDFNCYNFLKETYVDIKQAQNQMNIWNINFYVDNQYFSVLMDADTYYIYDIKIIYQDMKNMFSNDLDQKLTNYLNNYLELDSKQSEKYYQAGQGSNEYYSFFKISCTVY